MSIASLGSTTNSALTQAQALLQGHHARRALQAVGNDLTSQISALMPAQSGTGTPPAAGASGGFASSLGQLGTDVLSILGIGGGGASTPAAAASAYATSQSAI